MTMGAKIKQLRSKKGLSQEKLAEKLNVSRSAVAKWEADGGIPEIDNLLQLSLVFGISIDELVGNVTELANVTWKEENVQDITLHYIDIESHKIALQTEQERLLVLMEQAETVEDLITIESRLSEIRYQIQSYESTLRTYDNQVNYSTLHLAISEVKKLTPQEEPSVWKKIQDGFIENLDQVIKGVRDFFVEVMIAIPYLLLWGIVLFFGCWIGKKLIKKTKGKEVFWHFRKVPTTKNSKIDENNDNTEKQSRDEKK